MQSAVVQKSVSQLLGSAGWRNLGLWDTTANQDYETACKRLARTVGEAAQLDGSKYVLDVGFGSAAQILLWIEEMGVEPGSVVGVDIDASAVREATRDIARALGGPLPVLEVCDAVLLKPSSPLFDCVISVDNAYHFQTREAFLETTIRLLQPGGRMALADITTKSGLSWLGRIVLLGLKYSSSITNIPAENLISNSEYTAQLTAAGFVDIRSHDVTSKVFVPFAQHLYTAASLRRMPVRHWCLLRITALCMWLSSTCLEFSVWFAVKPCR